MTNGEEPLTKSALIEALGAFEQRLTDGVVRKLVGLEERIDGKLVAWEGRFDGKLIALEERLREYVHDTETKLLTAFQRFQVANEERLGHLEDFNSRATKRLAELEAAGRLATLELRVAEIEKKLDRRQ